MGIKILTTFKTFPHAKAQSPQMVKEHCKAIFRSFLGGFRGNSYPLREEDVFRLGVRLFWESVDDSADAVSYPGRPEINQ
jgi:hypothetical protein